MNTIELRVEMKRHGDTNESLAKALTITPPTCSIKSNKGTFSQEEIKAIKQRYSLKPERLDEIFF